MSIDTYKLREIAVEKYFGEENKQKEKNAKS